MADQASPGPVARRRRRKAAPSPSRRHRLQAPEPYHGRPVSWVAVSIIMAGFLVGGLGLVFGPTWWLFWVGRGDRRRRRPAGALATNIFDDWY